jgi:type VI secretion system protein ImpG
MDNPPSDAALKRMMQSVAFRAAHAPGAPDQRTPLLDALEPGHGRVMPSCAVAQVLGAAPATLARGTEFVTRARPACRYRTVYDVTLVPAAITSARFLPCLDMPAALGLPPECRSEIAIAIESIDPATPLDVAVATPLRVHIDARPALRSALYDALLLHAVCTCLYSDRQWCQLAVSPFAQVGYADSETLLPPRDGDEAALRLLAEYFAFPAKFDFFDIDLKPVLARCPAGTRRIVLHVALPQLDAAAALQGLEAATLRLGCTPVVNLFERDAEPVRTSAGHNAYPLRIAGGEALFSVDAVAHDGNVLAPFDGQHGSRNTGYWLLRHADTAAGAQDTISFVDGEQRPLDLPCGDVAVRVTCTNVETPAALRIGHPGGDLMAQGGTFPARLLMVPTAARPHAHPWHVLAFNTPAERRLSRQGLPALLNVLRLYDAPAQLLAGIVDLDRHGAAAWLRFPQGAAWMHGIEVRIMVDDVAFARRGVFTFAQVMERFLAYYAQARSFTQLIVVDEAGRELVRCAARAGTSLPL